MGFYSGSVNISASLVTYVLIFKGWYFQSRKAHCLKIHRALLTENKKSYSLRFLKRLQTTHPIIIMEGGTRRQGLSLLPLLEQVVLVKVWHLKDLDLESFHKLKYSTGLSLPDLFLN